MNEISKAQWRILFAAHLGWLLDGFDVMLFAFALTAIKKEFSLSSSTAGLLASATLISSAVGGILAGFLSDKLGRTKVLVYSILCYSFFTALTATAGSLGMLFLWRILVGFGLGGEWSAGSVLVAESWPAAHRGKAMGLMQSGWALGYILAALTSAALLPHFGWRPLFAIGILPALVTTWIRRQIPESPLWIQNGDTRKIKSELWSNPLIIRRIVISSLLSTVLLFAYWGLFTWIPTYLSTPQDHGGAGLSIVASAGWIVPMQIGAFFGYTSFGFFADRFGRRPIFLFFVLSAAALVPLYGLAGHHPWFLLAIGPIVGFAGHGYFSVFGALLAELFPSPIRGTAQGMCYNFGRAVSAAAPYVIGALSDRHGVGAALSLTSVFYILGAILIFLLPNAQGEPLN